jgi:hypothetical protein
MEVLLECIAEDWRVNFPYRIRYNRHVGVNRTAYALHCLVYYLIKDAILLLFGLLWIALRFWFYDIWVLFASVIK